MRLLSVDWDYFFENPSDDMSDPQNLLYDWGHSENWSSAMLATFWTHRAGAFMRSGVPLPHVNDEWRTFWDRFRFAKGATLYLADSHMYAADDPLYTPMMQEIWNFDAHHDCGYGENSVQRVLDRYGVDCGDWMVAYGMHGVRLKVRYPRWRTLAFKRETGKHIEIEVSRRFDNGKPMKHRLFHNIFLCRSGAWTPPWDDDRFEAFIALCPVKKVVRMEDYPPREFSLKAAQAYAEQMDELLGPIPEWVKARYRGEPYEHLREKEAA